MARRARWTRPALALVVCLATALAAVQADASVQVREKDVNLDIAKRVAASLREAGVRVRMTRNKDVTLRPRSRTDRANRLGADAFVSIHNNASRDPRVSGSEIFHSIRRDGSRALGAAIWRAFGDEFRPGRRNILRTRRGCCGDYYYQLRLPRMPAVLVEAAYVTDPVEGRRLGANPRFRQRLADAITAGILDWQSRLGGTPPARDPGLTAPAPLPPPLELTATPLRGQRVWLEWRTSALAEAYHVYRDGALIGIRRAPQGDLLDAGRPLRFVDRWAAPGQSYAYDVRPARALADGVTGEGAPALVTVETPPILVMLDPGHGGRDPGAIARHR